MVLPSRAQLLTEMPHPHRYPPKSPTAHQPLLTPTPQPPSPNPQPLPLQVRSLAAMAANTKRHGAPFRHMLFYGEAPVGGWGQGEALGSQALVKPDLVNPGQACSTLVKHGYCLVESVQIIAYPQSCGLCQPDLQAACCISAFLLFQIQRPALTTPHPAPLHSAPLVCPWYSP